MNLIFNLPDATVVQSSSSQACDYTSFWDVTSTKFPPSSTPYFTFFRRRLSNLQILPDVCVELVSGSVTVILGECEGRSPLRGECPVLVWAGPTAGLIWGDRLDWGEGCVDTVSVDVDTTEEPLSLAAAFTGFSGFTWGRPERQRGNTTSTSNIHRHLHINRPHPIGRKLS